MYGRHLLFDQVAIITNTSCESAVGTEQLVRSYLMWQNNRDKLTVARVVQRFSNFYETLETDCGIHNSSRLPTVLAYINLSHIFSLLLHNFILMLSSVR
jgi:hypothetical protein